MKWDNVFILAIDMDDPVIASSAMMWKERYQLTAEQCFYHTDAGQCPGRFPDFTYASQGAMRGKVTEQSKVMVIGHGNPSLAGGLPVEKFANYIKALGADNAGLLAIKCCHVGYGSFLARLKPLLPKVSWFIAPRGLTRTGKYLGVVHDIVILDKTEADGLLHNKGRKLSDKIRMKVEKGLGGYKPLGFSTRYGGKKSSCFPFWPFR